MHHLTDPPILRIVFWTKVFPPQYESFIVNQIAGVMELGCEVRIIAGKRGSDNGQLAPDVGKALGFQVVYTPPVPADRWRRSLGAAALAVAGACSSPRRTLRLLRRDAGPSVGGTARLLYEAQPLLRLGSFDILHCQYGPLGVLAAELKHRGLLAADIVTSFRGFDLSRVVKTSPGIYERLFQVGSRFLPVCDAFAQRLEELGCPRERIAVLRTGIDMTAFPFRPRTLSSGQTVQIMTAGRLVEKKGIEDALRAVAELVRGGLPVHYTIIGDGPLRQSLVRFAGELGIAGQVSFLGWLAPAEVRAALDRAQVVLNPSRTAAEGSAEGIPNSLKEAMACGIPVVATRHSGIPELVQDGVSGYLASEADPASLGDCLARLIAEPQRWAEMGQAGRARVERDYDLRRANEELVAIYREIQDERRTQTGGQPLAPPRIEELPS
jgi:colanic acid/amylovoran biosynthesis glycosyltransferase